MNISSFFNFKKRENYHDKGKNNRVVFVSQNGTEIKANLKNIKVNFIGDNNVLKIHLPMDLRDSYFLFRCNNSVIEIKKYSHANLHIECIDDNSEFYMGENCYVGGLTAVLSGNKVFIGDNCMFSEKILFLDDTHSVLDNETRQVLNSDPEELTIGNHVWIGEHVTLLKKTKIPDDCIVGYGSIVTKSFLKKHCIIVGNPAKVVKEGISWNSLSPKKYTKDKAKGMKV